MKKLIECVPNFSEGINLDVIKQITNEIEAVSGVLLLDVDPGESTNRTVVTMVGTPDEVCEAAFRAIKKASELIDMSKHKGAHPRFGATDVCPLVPVSNVTMEEAVVYAHRLAERVGMELEIPVYCYEEAAIIKERKNLAYCRSGEYEGLKEKLAKPEWKPDFGPSTFNSKSGAIAIGARDFLVAINYNLNTTSTRKANALAFDVREKGRPLREGHPITGKILKDEKGNDLMLPGTLKATKAIGWFIEEYGIAQVSMNITNISVTPVHIAFDEICDKAIKRGLRVTGSEIVGLIPKRVLIEAGKYFLIKQERSVGVSEDELIKIAIKSMGLDDLKPFNPKEKVIEFLLEDKDSTKKLIDLSCKDFCNETAGESPAPGGGSVSAFMASMGAALATMVANLSSHKRGWEDKWNIYSTVAEKGQAIKDELLFLIDEDTNSFNLIMNAMSLPKSNPTEISLRKESIQKATQYATEIPLRTMRVAYSSFELCRDMANNGLSSSISDVGVGALALNAGIKGAFLNVKINATQLENKELANKLILEGQKIVEDSEIALVEILSIVNEKI